MENNSKNYTYDTSSEKELIKMWEDIKSGNTSSLNRSLMKAISIAEEGKEIDQTCKYSKEMWDSDEWKWVPFDLWGAHFIVNSRKEKLLIRIYRPLSIQPEFGDTLWAFHTLDGSFLTEKLKEKENPYKNYEDNLKLFSGEKAWREMIRQDKQEKQYEDPYSFRRRSF